MSICKEDRHATVECPAELREKQLYYFLASLLILLIRPLSLVAALPSLVTADQLGCSWKRELVVGDLLL
jgi:hypothetical protein